MYHELAPTWRKLASEFEGVMRIAPVSCEDDWALFYQLKIEFYQGSYVEYNFLEFYPSLHYYEKEVDLYEGQRYRSPRTFRPYERLHPI
jgi:hypothetical protein